MSFTKDEIRRGMLLYAVTDQSWLKEGQTLLSVCETVLANGATFLQIREKDLDAACFEAEATRKHPLRSFSDTVPILVKNILAIPNFVFTIPALTAKIYTEKL